MIKYFKNANEFISFKKTCLMCGSPLKPIITNFTGISGKLCSIKSLYKDDSFKFKIDYTSASINVSCDVTIDCESNNIKFYNEKCWVLDPQHKSITAFEMMDLHLESYCSNSECKHKYYVSTDVIKIEDGKEQCIKPLRLYCECFTVGKVVVLNDYQNSTTNIFSNKKSNAQAIEMAILDFSSLEQEKIINKIKTFVNFS